MLPVSVYEGFEFIEEFLLERTRGPRIIPHDLVKGHTGLLPEPSGERPCATAAAVTFEIEFASLEEMEEVISWFGAGYKVVTDGQNEAKPNTWNILDTEVPFPFGKSQVASDQLAPFQVFKRFIEEFSKPTFPLQGERQQEIFRQAFETIKMFRSFGDVGVFLRKFTERIALAEVAERANKV